MSLPFLPVVPSLPIAASSPRAVRLSELESKIGLGELERRAGDWKLAGNLSGVVGEDGEKRRWRFRMGGGVSQQDITLTAGRLHGDVFGGVPQVALDSCLRGNMYLAPTNKLFST